MPAIDGQIDVSDAGARTADTTTAITSRRSLDAFRLGVSRLTVRAPDLFLSGDLALRRFVARAFAVPEVRAVTVLRERGVLRVELGETDDPARVWRRLGQVLRDGELDEAPLLDGARPLELRALTPGAPVRVTRVGGALTTFRVRVLATTQVRITHPLLRRRDVLFRVREMLISIHGVVAVRSAPMLASVVVTFDPGLVDITRILRLLDDSWPRFVAGFNAPPLPRKLALAGGLLTFSTAAQFFNPALLPWATAAVLLYSAPNLFAALRDLARGRVGLPALYSAGLGFLLWSRLPFASSVMATFTQAWPALSQRLAVDAERKLFAEHRRRLVWARRLGSEPDESIADLDRLAPGDVIVVRAGDYLPADGFITEGSAAIDEHVVLGGRIVSDKTVGDRVHAGTCLRDGAIALRVERVGDRTALAELAANLPHGALTGLASSEEAERIANRNAKPTLAFAAATLLITRTPRLSQVVLRPDYATAPRLSAHLSSLAGLAEALSEGVLLRDPSAIDRLRGADYYVFDDALDIDRREISVRVVRSWDRIGAREALALALAAFDESGDPRAPAIASEAARRSVSQPFVSSRQRLAGAIRFHDEAGGLVTVGTLEHLRRAGLTSERTEAAMLDDRDAGRGAPPPVVVLRGRDVVGVVHFALLGAKSAVSAIAALRTHSPQARIVHLSGLRQTVAEDRTADVGFDAVFGELDPLEKAETIRSLGGRSIWIGDGANPDSIPARLASRVSVSIAGLDALAGEQADIALLRGDPHSLLVALEAADRHAARLRGDYRTVYLANIAAILGGFFAGFGSLRAGLVSNGGTAAVFLSRWRALRGLSAEFASDSFARRVETPVSFGVRTSVVRSGATRIEGRSKTRLISTSP